MRTRCAVLYEMGKPRPYTQSSPLVVEDLEHLKGLLPVDELVSPSIRLEDVNIGFDRLSDGSDTRQPVHR